VEDVERPVSRTDLIRFREEKGITHQVQARHRRAQGPRVEANVQVPDRYRWRGRLSRAQRPRTGARGFRGGNPIRFPFEVADQACGQRRESPRIDPGSDKVRATALGAARCKQGQSQKQYDSSCPRRDDLIEKGEPFHWRGLPEEAPSSSRGQARNREICGERRSKYSSNVQTPRINCKHLFISCRFTPDRGTQALPSKAHRCYQLSSRVRPMLTSHPRWPIKR
jgi:hypothetical protein